MKTYVVASNLGAEYEVRIEVVRAVDEQQALVQVFRDSYPGLPYFRSYSDVLAFLHNQEWAIGVRELTP